MVRPVVALTESLAKHPDLQRLFAHGLRFDAFPRWARIVVSLAWVAFVWSIDPEGMAALFARFWNVAVALCQSVPRLW